GMLFVVSAASISAALMMLIGHRSRWTMPGLAALHRLDRWTIALEFVVLVAVMLSLGSIVRAWLNVWGVLLFFGVILGGMVIPSAIYWRSRRPGDLGVMTACVLVLLGGLILRMVIIFAGQGRLRELIWTLR